MNRYSSGTSYISVDDQFCGAGGSSIGITRAGGEVVRAWNHNKTAIDTHSRNFPGVDHILQDLTLVDPRRYSPATILVTSPECKHHGNGDGQKKPTTQLPLTIFEDDEIDPAAERSRMTMRQVIRFAEVLRYEAIVAENVVEVMKWRFWNDWISELRKLGYRIQLNFLNSVFFAPCPQSRDRIYVVCTKQHLPAPNLDFRPRAWCPTCQTVVEAIQTWRNPHRPYGKWGKQYDYRCPQVRCQRVVIPFYYCAWNMIDWSLPATRIGDREAEGKKPLKPNTRRRIEAGLKKFGQQPAVVDLSRTHGHDKRVWPLLEMLRTQTTAETSGVYVPPLLLGQQSQARAKPVTEPSPAIATAGGISITIPPFTIGQQNGYSARPVTEPWPVINTGTGAPLVIPPYTVSAGGPEVGPRPLTEPANTFLARDHVGVVIPPFVQPLDHEGKEAEALDRPLSTQTARQDKALVIPPFIVEFRNNMDSRLLTDMLGAVTAGGIHHGLAFPPFIGSYYGGRDAVSQLSDPIPTQPAQPRHSLIAPPGFPFLTSYYGQGGNHSLGEPMPTQPSKDRHALVQPVDVRVDDCLFRMLHWMEIRRGMAFADSYEILGTIREKVSQLGNAVTPPVMEFLIRCVIEVLNPRQV